MNHRNKNQLEEIPHIDFFDKTKKLFGEISNLITSVQSIDAVLQKIMDQVELFFTPKNWSLIRLDDASNELFFQIVKGIDPKKVKDIRLKLGEGIAGTVAKTKKTILIEDVSKSKDFSQKVDKASGFVTKSIVAVPIIFGERVFGVIQLINKVDGSSFTKHDLFVLETIGKFSGIAFVNAMYYEEIVNLSQRDALTGLFNRNKLEKTIKSWISDSNNYAIAILIDLNDFKLVNDTSGHKEGDLLLKTIAKRLTALLRPGDLLFRLGGDEFLILAEGTEKELKIEIKLYEKKLNKASRLSSSINCFSFGLYLGRKIDLEELIQEADKKMYEHKKETKKKK